ncbi:MAG: hypothetical protein A2Y21_11580 [Clostridiales bacterium GWC2_40_7]|nr:MAG: hypothetical protein A2Y21_11580 [Clostridiales bacterium GWC2_40_7]
MYKLLICDDEKWVRYGLRNMTDWDKMGIDTIYEAKDGIEAVDIVKCEKPDIIITDIKMPNLSGLELIREIEKAVVPSNIIVISGFNDFKYAQEALRYGIRDYILKPIDEEVIKNDVLKCIKDIEEKNEKASKRKSELQLFEYCMSTSQVYYLSSWLENKYTDQHGIIDILAQLNIDINYNYVFVTTCLLGKVNSTDYKSMTLKRFIFDQTKEMVSAAINCISFLKGYNEYTIILFTDLLIKDKHFVKDIIDNNVEEICNNSHNMSQISVGIGTLVPLNQIAQSYEESVKAAKYKLLFPHNNFFFYEDLKRIKEKKPGDSLAFHVSKLINYIKLSRLEECRGWIESFFQSIVDNADAINPEDITSVVHIVLNELENVCNNKRKVDFKLLKENVDSALQLEELKDILAGSLECIPYNSNKMKKSIETAIHYIDENYAKSIKMQEVAGMLWLNNSYFSKIFNDYMGESFTKYLNRKRINMAKELLSQSNEKVYEIAEKVGYEDYRVFSKNFKDLEGITPIEYRDKLRP